MATIYLVGMGEYSDYHIVAACSTLEMAEAWIKPFTYGDGRCGASIEEHEIDADQPPWPNGRTLWKVTLTKDNQVVEAHETHLRTYEQGPLLTNVEWDIPGPRKRKKNPLAQPKATFRCWARDKEHAIKICSDRNRAILATNTWGERYDYTDNKTINRLKEQWEDDMIQEWEQPSGAINDTAT